jgi:hypothetical protein
VSQQKLVPSPALGGSWALANSIQEGDPDEAERVLFGHIRRTRLHLARHSEVLRVAHPTVDCIQLVTVRWFVPAFAPYYGLDSIQLAWALRVLSSGYEQAQCGTAYDRRCRPMCAPHGFSVMPMKASWGFHSSSPARIGQRQSWPPVVLSATSPPLPPQRSAGLPRCSHSRGETVATGADRCCDRDTECRCRFERLPNRVDQRAAVAWKSR